MKKILFSIAAVASIFAACNQTPQYTINGTIVGDKATGNALLVKRGEKGLDTLAKAAINNEKFVLTGNTANMTNAYIIIEGKRGSIPVILENTKYTATIDYSNPMATKVEGGEAQALYNQAIDIARANPDAEAKIYKAYGEARKNNDTAQMRQLREEFDQIAAQKAAREDSLIQANANTYTAAVLIAEKMNRLSLEDMEKRFNLLGETAKATEPGKKVAEKSKAF